MLYVSKINLHNKNNKKIIDNLKIKNMENNKEKNTIYIVKAIRKDPFSTGDDASTTIYVGPSEEKAYRLAREIEAQARLLYDGLFNTEEEADTDDEEHEYHVEVSQLEITENAQVHYVFEIELLVYNDKPILNKKTYLLNAQEYKLLEKNIGECIEEIQIGNMLFQRVSELFADLNTKVYVYKGSPGKLIIKTDNEDKKSKNTALLPFSIKFIGTSVYAIKDMVKKVLENEIIFEDNIFKTNALSLKKNKIQEILNLFIKDREHE